MRERGGPADRGIGFANELIPFGNVRERAGGQKITLR